MYPGEDGGSTPPTSTNKQLIKYTEKNSNMSPFYLSFFLLFKLLIVDITNPIVNATKPIP